MRYRYILADVFTDQIFGGNPLAVFPEATGLDPATMQLIARELNLSETVFIFPPQTPGHTCRLRIFTPGVELPFAGHPTVGAAHVLTAAGYVRLPAGGGDIVFEEGVGPVPVRVQIEDGRPVFSQLSAARMPEFRPATVSPEQLARMLNLDPADIGAGEDEPEAISCGVPFLFVPLRNLEAVRRARLDRGVWERHLAGGWATEVYVFSYEASPGMQIHARMFAPAMGIGEDPATGAAATALAGYLAKRSGCENGSLHWKVEQGLEMGRPSLLQVEAEVQNGAVTAIRVGGSSVIVGQGHFDLPAGSVNHPEP